VSPQNDQEQPLPAVYPVEAPVSAPAAAADSDDIQVGEAVDFDEDDLAGEVEDAIDSSTETQEALAPKGEEGMTIPAPPKNKKEGNGENQPLPVIVGESIGTSGPTKEDFDRARGKEASLRPAEKKSTSGSLVLMNIMMTLEGRFGLEFPDADDLPTRLVTDLGALLLEPDWNKVKGEENLREALLDLLPRLDPKRYQPTGTLWKKTDTPSLRVCLLTALEAKAAETAEPFKKEFADTALALKRQLFAETQGRLKSEFGLEFPKANEMQPQLALDMAMMLIEKKVVVDLKRRKTAIIQILCILNPTKYFPEGSIRNVGQTVLKKLFVDELKAQPGQNFKAAAEVLEKEKWSGEPPRPPGK
jgi:hypothetical protein